MPCHGTCTTLCQVRLDNFRDGASLQLQRLPVAARRSERARLRTQNRRRIESIRQGERPTDRPRNGRPRERWTESGRVSSEQLALKRWTSETNVESKLAIIAHSFLRSFAHSRGSTSYSVGFHPTALALTIPSSSVAERHLGEARD